LKKVGAHRAAARAAGELAAIAPAQWRDKLLAAHILVGCASASESDTKLSSPERESVARSYTDRAGKLLDDATGLIGGDLPALKELAADLADCHEFSAFRNPRRAIGVARKVTQLAPEDTQAWIILGVAHCRAGDANAAIEAIEKSMQLGAGGDAYDWFFLAMAWWQKGDKERARSWYDKAVQWMEKNPSPHETPRLRPGTTASSSADPYRGSKNEDLRRYRHEAAALLGVTDAPRASIKKEERTTQSSKP
jgi:tetratricopeptide (TPR) repeat protein